MLEVIDDGNKYAAKQQRQNGHDQNGTIVQLKR